MTKERDEEERERVKFPLRSVPVPILVPVPLVPARVFHFRVEFDCSALETGGGEWSAK